MGYITRGYVTGSLLLATLFTSAQVKDCATCSTQRLSLNDVRALSIDDLQLLKNELFARKGHVFETPGYREYFAAQPWYRPGGNKGSMQLGPIEKENVDLMLQRIAALQQGHRQLAEQLTAIGALVKKNDRMALRRLLTGKNGQHVSDEAMGYFVQIVPRLVPEQIHWVGHRGLYKAMIDDGNTCVSYSVEINEKEGSARLGYNQHGNTELAEENPPPGKSFVPEFAWFFLFDIVDGKLVFNRVEVAG